MDMQGHITVVTGGGAGLGRGAALGFAERGASVAVVDIDAAAARRTCEEIRAFGGKALALQADVGVEASVDEAFSRIEKEWGGINSLVNVAGVELFKGFLEITPAEWDKQIAVNLKSVFLCGRRAVPLMKAGGGAIVNTASVQALATTGNIAAYAAAKGGIIAMSRDMARDLGPLGIRVNTICPGCLHSPMLDRSYPSREARDKSLAELAAVLPLRRIGEPRDFANLAVFLAGPMSSYVTGQAIVLDGGMMCRLPLV